MRLLVLLLLAAPALAQAPAPKDFDITSPDGTKLRATLFAAAKPGPGVMLLHMCNTVRKSWEPVAKQLADSGINALTIDNRGFGESGGPNFDKASPEVQQQVRQQWPADFDAAYEYLVAQPGVDKARVGAGGGSCGVDNAVKLAERHPGIKSLVLLAGPSDPEGVTYLVDHPEIALFTSAAADDQYFSAAPQLMKWFRELSDNPRSEFVGFSDGKHGTEIFGPHPELVRDITNFFADTLGPNGSHPKASGSPRDPQVAEFWKLASQPGGAARAAQMYHAARQRDPSVNLFPESLINFLGYTRLRATDEHAKRDALDLFKLNTEAYPASANAQDSLSDAYLAAGQKDLALTAEERCLALLPNDASPADFKAGLKEQAEKKIAELKGSTK